MGQVWSFNTVVILRVAFEGDAVLSPAHKPAFQSCRCQPPKPGTHHAHRALVVYQNARMHMTYQDLFQAGMSRARSTLSRPWGNASRMQPRQILSNGKQQVMHNRSVIENSERRPNSSMALINARPQVAPTSLHHKGKPPRKVCRGSSCESMPPSSHVSLCSSSGAKTLTDIKP